MPRHRKTGLPRSIEEEERRIERLEKEGEALTPEEFVEQMFDDGTAEPQFAPDGRELPSLEWLKATFSTKSAAIRYLRSQQFEVKTIAKHLGVRYQHVRNVSTQKLKRGPNEDWTKPYHPPQQEPKADENDDVSQKSS
jgi:hypothetical protein